jgi:hypothetical protein
VNIFNCLQIFAEYIQKVCGNHGAHMHDFYGDNDAEIEEVMFPTANGFYTISIEEVYNYWSEISLISFHSTDRLSKYSDNDTLRRQCIYLAIVKMHEQSLLDAHNKPTTEAAHYASIWYRNNYGSSNALPSDRVFRRIKNRMNPKDLMKGDTLP